MSDFLNNFVEWSNDQLFCSEVAVDFLHGRGSSEYQWRKHSIGFVSNTYVPDSDLDSGHGEYCYEEADKNRVCDTCRFKKWSTLYSKDDPVVGGKLINNIVYPLTTYSGQILGVQVRSIREKRYDTFMRKYRPEPYFFGTKGSIDKIWLRKKVILVEGPSDMLTVERFCDLPVLALTTNSTNESQTRFLKLFVQNILLCLDNDIAGREGTNKIYNKLQEYLTVSIVDYKKSGLKAKDLNEMWQVLKDENFASHLKSVLTELEGTKNERE